MQQGAACGALHGAAASRQPAGATSADGPVPPGWPHHRPKKRVAQHAPLGRCSHCSPACRLQPLQTRPCREERAGWEKASRCHKQPGALRASQCSTLVAMGLCNTGRASEALHPTAARSRLGTAQHRTAQHSAAQHSTARHSTAQHSTAPHGTAQRSTAQRSTPECRHLVPPGEPGLGEAVHKEHEWLAAALAGAHGVQPARRGVRAGRADEQQQRRGSSGSAGNGSASSGTAGRHQAPALT